MFHKLLLLFFLGGEGGVYEGYPQLESCQFDKHFSAAGHDFVLAVCHDATRPALGIGRDNGKLHYIEVYIYIYVHKNT